MGQGGYIVLVNGTKYNWKAQNQDKSDYSYQMNNWKFPNFIYAGSTAAVYIEWNEGVLSTISDDSGRITYALDGTGLAFQIQADAKDGYNIRVVLSNISTQGNTKGSVINLGWIDDGDVNFILSGDADNFTSSNIPTSWMQNNLNLLGNRSLREICMPGSHDAGMSVRGIGTAGAFDCNVLTQTTGILGQLQSGARYFDIRPVIAGGGYLTGHYTFIDETVPSVPNISAFGPPVSSPTSTVTVEIKTWQGANGQSIRSVIDDVNTYTANNKELIILYLSHDHNTDSGNSSFTPFTQEEWNGVFKLLAGLNNLFIVNNKTDIDLTTLPLNKFISRNNAAVIVVVDPSGSSISLGNYTGRGFYTPTNFPVYNSYSSTNDPVQMATDQLSKMNTERPNPGASYFLLSWTLTQNNTEATVCKLPGVSSIMDLASQAHPPLYEKLLRYSSGATYPNIIYIDNVHSSDIAALAMAVNSVAAYSIGGNYLRPNSQLALNDTLISPDGQYQLILQPDGNLVLYRTSDKYSLWSSGTQDKDAKRAAMQPDGNFVIYDANNNALWASGTNGQNDSFLSMQDDGNLVIYNKANAAVWASKTNQ